MNYKVEIFVSHGDLVNIDRRRTNHSRFNTFRLLHEILPTQKQARRGSGCHFRSSLSTAVASRYVAPFSFSFSGSSHMNIICIYRPPPNKNNTFSTSNSIRKIQDLLFKQTSSHERYLILGDLTSIMTLKRTIVSNH